MNPLGFQLVQAYIDTNHYDGLVGEILGRSSIVLPVVRIHTERLIVLGEVQRTEHRLVVEAALQHGYM